MKLLEIDYEKYFLDNGLKVIFYQDKKTPLVAINIWYYVGSADEINGKTGLAHLFEHMMFQGSMNVEKGMHFKLIQEAGGTLNASTSFDRTNYFDKVPSNFLELILWLESDRMGFFLPALTQEKLNNQKDVVKNERLERYDNQPYGLAWEKVLSNTFNINHPYSWPTIGWMNDIINYNMEDVQNFFKNYYQPQNASLVVAGNFDKSQAKELITKYFSDIKNNSVINRIIEKQNVLSQNKFISYIDEISLERIYLVFNSDIIYSQDDPVLEIFSDILTGSKNGRLSKYLVYEIQSCVNVSSFQFSGKHGGFFCIVATAKQNQSLDLIKEQIFQEINKIILDGIDEHDLIRAKNKIKSSFIYSLQSIDLLADQLNNYEFYLSEPNSFNYDLQRYELIKTEDLISIAKKYLLNNHFELRILDKSKNNA